MKKVFLLLSLVAETMFSQVLISVDDTQTNMVPHNSAALEVKSNDTGFLPPRMNNAPSTPSEGLIYYDLDEHCLKGWNGTKWENLGQKLTLDINSTVHLHNVSPMIQGLGLVYSIEADNIYSSGAISQLYKDIGTSFLRWPGGTVTTYYHWNNLTGNGWSDNW